jgi:eukaryotic-like serine/threonine-protein kinase
MRRSNCLLSFFVFLVGMGASRAQPAISWKFKTGAPIVGSPVIEQEVAYFGGLDSSFYCVKLENGEKLWSIKTGGEIRSTPYISQGRIFFTSGDGNLYCVDSKGKKLWTFRTGGEKRYPLFSFADYFHSSPVVEGGRVYFGSGDSCIYAVNTANGKQVWKYKTNSIVHTRPCVYAGRVYIGSFDGWFYALDRVNGSLAWKFKSVGQQYFPKGEFNGSATAFDGVVYVGARDYNFYALDTSAPFCRWNQRFQRGWAITRPLITDSVLYFGTSDDHLLLSVRPENGNVIWTTDLGYNLFGAPAVSDSVVYIGTMMGHLFGVGKRSGKIVFDFTTDGYRKNRSKYFKGDDTYRDDIFSSVIKRNEDFLDLYIDMGGIISEPAFYKNRILFTSMDGTFYCVAK